jgi:serine/threonine-protein kinase HipA
MRPKFLIDLNISNHSNIRYTTGIPKDNFSPVIIKTPGKDEDHYQRLEYLYSQLAKKCDINIPDTFLLTCTTSKMAFFAIKRFDILENGDRLHAHTLAGLHGINFSEISFDYSDLLRTTQDISRDHRQVVEAYRRMVFNYLSNNKDDHTKNFSFVMNSEGNWTLSPAYDISYSPGDAGLHSMSINGIRRNASLKDFEKMAKIFNIKSWKEIVAHISEILKCFPAFASKLNISRKYSRIVNDRINEHVRRVDKDLSFGLEL